MSQVLDPTLDPAIRVSLSSCHGWKNELYVVSFPGGLLAYNDVDTKGMGPEEPMSARGLALHQTVASVEVYLEAHKRDLPPGGEAKPCLYDLARKIAIEKGVDALLLFEGARVVDMEFLK